MSTHTVGDTDTTEPWASRELLDINSISYTRLDWEGFTMTLVWGGRVTNDGHRSELVKNHYHRHTAH